MDEREITAGEILGALRSGALSTVQNVSGYAARKQTVRVIFTFDDDNEGTVMVIITTIRGRR